MSSSDKGSEGGTIATAAGVAVATGIGWSIFKSLTGGKKEPPPQHEPEPSLLDSGKEEEDADKKEFEDVIVAEEAMDEKVPDFAGSDGELDFKEEVKPAPEPEPKQPQNENIFEKAWKFFGNNKKKESSTSPPTKSSAAAAAIGYEIQKGDTLWGISRKYGVTLDTLKAANGLSVDEIYAGDKLVIPPK